MAKVGKGRKGGMKASITKIVKKAMAKEIELKETEQVIQQSPASGSMETTLVNGVAEGISDYQRIGNEVNAKYLRLKGSVTFPDATNRVRIMVVLDKQPNGLAPSLASLFTFTGNPVSSFINTDSKGRFRVIRDQIYAGGAQGPVCRSFDWYIKLAFKSYYSTAGATIADVRTNALWVISVSDSAVVSHPYIESACRFAYTD